MKGHHELILGGARSGKSTLAQQHAHHTGKGLIYLATADSNPETRDGEMAERIERHKANRGLEWHLIEEPLQLCARLEVNDSPDHCIVVDCLTMWLSNCLAGACWQEQRRALLERLPDLQSHIIFVGNETGMGVVPVGALTRTFVDESGFLHQRLGVACDAVTLTVAGFPVQLK